MTTYKQVKKINSTDMEFVLKTPEMKYIPFDPANTDYQKYLKWLAEGNTPLPADGGNN
jgi:hypothetical protein